MGRRKGKGTVQKVKGRGKTNEKKRERRKESSVKGKFSWYWNGMKEGKEMYKR